MAHGIVEFQASFEKGSFHRMFRTLSTQRLTDDRSRFAFSKIWRRWTVCADYRVRTGGRKAASCYSLESGMSRLEPSTSLGRYADRGSLQTQVSQEGQVVAKVFLNQAQCYRGS